MAVLETIRVKFGVLITVLIAIALLSFIVDPSVFNSCTSGNGEVAEIDGESISYIDYQTEVEKSRVVLDMDPRTRGAADNAGLQGYVWSKLLNEYGFFGKFEDAGILVSDYNIAAALQSNPDYNYLVAMQNQRPDLKVVLDDMIFRTKSMLYETQYNKLFQYSSFANPMAIANEMNEKSDKTQYVEIPVTGAETVEVSEAEAKAWYDAHIEGFKLSASRKDNRNIDFAVFELNPSEADIEKARVLAAEELDELNEKALDEFTETRYFMDNELVAESSKLDEFVFGDTKKEAELIADGNSFYAVRILDKKMLPDTVSFVCVPADGENTADSLFANPDAQTFEMTYNQLDDNFMNVSDFVEGALNKGFVATTKGQQDLLVKVTDRSAKSLHKKISYAKEVAFVSEETDNNISEIAHEFSAKATDYASFATELAAIGQKDALHRVELSSSMYDLPYEGSRLTNARELVKWAFEAKAGEASGVLKLDKAYVVAGLESINESGYVPFEQVKSSIENRVRIEKRIEAMKAEISAKIAGKEDMEAIAAALESKVSTEDVIFSYSNLDPKFVGAVAGSEVNKVYGPVAGNNSIFIYKVVERGDRNPMLEEDITNRKFNPYLEQGVMMNIGDALYSTIDVEDSRIKFM